MQPVFRRTWALMLGMLLIMMGNGLASTLLGVRGSLESISSGAMGLIMSAYFVGFLGGSTLTPKMLRRVGHVRTFAALGSTVSAAFLLFSIWVDPYFWFVLRLLVGFCLAGLYVVAESWLNDISTNETRGKTLSLYMIMQMTGLVTGQLLLNVSDPGGYTLFILVSVLVSISFAPILLSSSPAPVFDSAQPMTFRELYTASPLGTVSMFLLGGAFSVILSMSPVYAAQIELSVGQISTYVTAIFLGGMFMQFPIGWLSDHIDRRLLIIVLSAIAGSLSLSVFVVGNDFIFLVFLSFVLGAMVNPLYSLIVAHTNDFLAVEKMASASGSLMFINGLGAMGGPFIVGYIMRVMGPNGFYLFISVLLLTMSAYGIYRSTKRATVDEPSPHVNIYSDSTPVFSQVAAEWVVDEIEEHQDYSPNEIEEGHQNLVDEEDEDEDDDEDEKY